MKKYFKIVPLALALVAMASCQEEDILSQGAKQEKVKGGLTVNVEELATEGIATRQGNVATGNGIVWENGDLINVYDQKLAIYDEYEFQTDKFVGINKEAATRISSTKFALFPADHVDYAGWSAKEGAKAVMTIPELIIYDEDTEGKAGDSKYYVSNLPMWGTATGTYPEAEVDLKFLTSVLKVNIVNAFANNITFLKVEAQDNQPISGAFEAILDAENPNDAVMKVGAKSLITSKAMYVDLRNVPSYMTYIYLPIIARHYDYLKVGVTSMKATEASALEENSDLIVSDLEKLAFTEDASTGWLTIRNWEAGVDFTKSSVKPLSKETQYNLDNVYTCEMLSKALEQYKDATGTVEFEIGANGTNGGLEITREGDKDDYTIYVPSMAADKVIINIPKGIYADYTNCKLEIVDKNIKAPYEKEIVFNAAEVKNQDLNAVINLPKTDFTLAGDFNATKALKTLEVKNVDKLTIGDGVTPTVIQKGASITVSTASEVVVENGAEVRADLNLVETKNLTDVRIMEGGSISTTSKDVKLSVLNANVHVQGVVDDVYVYSSTPTTFIGEGVADGVIGNLYTIGKVNIDEENEAEAISGVLSALGNNTITLKQGYIKSIVYDNSKQGFKPGTTLYSGKYVVKNITSLSASDKLNKLVKVTFAEGEGLTAIANISDDLLEYADGADYYNWLQFTNASTWSGETIDGATFPGYIGNSLLKIYTATELASSQDASTGLTLKLYNDLNLNSLEWTNPTLNNSFDGKDPRYDNSVGNKHASRITDVTAVGVDGVDCVHTISNLALKNAESAQTENFGLFGSTAGVKARNIQNFILDGVTCDLAVVSSTVPKNVGAIIGKDTNTGAQNFTNIEVKNAVIGGTAVVNNETKDAVGIRYASTMVGTLNTTGTETVTFTGNKIAGSVTGQAYMGGVVGYVKSSGSVGVAANIISTTFTVPTSAQPSNYDFAIMDCGTIGMVAGQFASETKDLVIIGNTITDNIANNRAALGFKFNFAFETSTKYGFHGKAAEVGYSPAFADNKLNIGTQSYISQSKKYASKAASEADTEANILNSYIQWTPWEE